MPSLEISINCLCVFVPNPRAGVMHVLMPPTQGHHEHVVRVLHHGSPEKGKPMEGWALKLGGVPQPAETTLQPRHPATKGETIVDLSGIAGPVDPTLLEDDAFPRRVAARVDLRAGYVDRLNAEAQWRLRSGRIVMAHQVVWKIDDISDAQVEWTRMPGGVTDQPFASLAELGSGNNLKLDIYHVTEDALPPKASGTLDPAEVQAHFRAFYAMFGHSPRPNDLPSDPRRVEPVETIIAELARAAREERDEAAIERLAALAEELAQGRRRGLRRRTPSLPEALRRVDRYNCPTARGNLS